MRSASPTGARGWRHPLSRLALEGALCAAGFAAVTLPLLAGYRATGVSGRLGLALLAACGYLAVYGFVVGRVEGRPVHELGLRRTSRVLLGLGIGAALVTMTVACLAALGGYRVTATAPIAGLIARVGPSVHAAVWEELAFRGLLYRCLADWLGTRRALAASALVFGAMHGILDNGSVVSGVAVALEAGVLLSLAFWATRDLWLPIGMHAGWNLTLGGVFGSAVSGSPVPGVIVPAIEGPVWLTGGPFGLEASVPAVLICLAASAAFWRAGRKSRHTGRGSIF